MTLTQYKIQPYASINISVIGNNLYKTYNHPNICHKPINDFYNSYDICHQANDNLSTHQHNIYYL